MTELRGFHTSVFDFATKVMTSVDSQRGGSDRSSQGIRAGPCSDWKWFGYPQT